MKFVIVGYGRVGMRTAGILDPEGHDVVVVDNDPDKVDRAETEGSRPSLATARTRAFWKKRAWLTRTPSAG